MAKVMVVDDSPTDIANLKRVLEKAGHTVIEVSDGKNAVQRAKDYRPDAILMDVVMPGVNGFQATRTLSRDPDTQHIPIIVVSSKNQETDRVWALRQGAREYLVKPFKDADLLGRLDTLLTA